MPGPSRGGGRLGTEALYPRVPRRSQLLLADSCALKERLRKQEIKLETEKSQALEAAAEQSQALAAAAERAWQRRAASLSC